MIEGYKGTIIEGRIQIEGYAVFMTDSVFGLGMGPASSSFSVIQPAGDTSVAYIE